MALSSPNKLFDPFRKRWVEATPEEWVRQKWLHVLTQEKGFPKSLIAIERSLSDLSFGSKEQIPNRRIDIVCFAKNLHPLHELYPMLIIECKEGTIEESAKQQVIGYNHYVNAYFLALASPSEFLLGHYSDEKQGYDFYPSLPSFNQLISTLSHAIH